MNLSDTYKTSNFSEPLTSPAIPIGILHNRVTHKVLLTPTELPIREEIECNHIWLACISKRTR